MGTQATDKLVVVDGMPSVEKLWNGRFRLEFFCKPSNKNEGWYGDNIDKWLPEFGTLQGADFTGEGWEALDGEVYPNMCLVEADAPYIPPSESHLVKLVYETLTASWELEKDEDIDYELNGLKRVTRQSVALPDTDYLEVVGTSTIDSDGVTLYLGSYKIVETDAKWTLQEIWLEAGTLSESVNNVAEGVQNKKTTFLHIEGTVIGPVIARSIDNFEGLKTISVTTMQGKDGESIIDGGERLANSYEQLSQFTYPGIVETSFTPVVGSLSSYLSYQWTLTPPVQGLIEATTYVIFQSASEISPSDYTYAGAKGLWNPLSWASGETYGIGFNYSPFAESKGFRGYRAIPSVESFIEGLNQSGPNYLINGNRIFAGNRAGISIKGGPEDPIGNTYTLNVKITPAFEDIDGVTSYKKVISVSTIPSPPYILTVNSGTGSGEYAGGEVVPISTTVESNQLFTGWIADDGEIADSSALSTNFTMPNESAIVTATFVYDPSALYELDVFFGSGDGDYTYNTAVELVADNRPGKTFTHWSTSDGGIIWSPTSSTTYYTMPPNDSLVTANYT